MSGNKLELALIQILVNMKNVCSKRNIALVSSCRLKKSIERQNARMTKIDIFLADANAVR